MKEEMMEKKQDNFEDKDEWDDCEAEIQVDDCQAKWD